MKKAQMKSVSFNDISKIRLLMGFIIASISKIIFLYGGDTHHIEPLHRLMNVQSQNKKFSLIIIRVGFAVSFNGR